jgi:hypothetical protein
MEKLPKNLDLVVLFGKEINGVSLALLTGRLAILLLY